MRPFPLLSRHFLAVTLSVGVFFITPAAIAQSGTPEDLRSILETREIAIDALNTQDFAKVEAYLHPDFTITTVDNQIFHSAAEFEAYWTDQFANNIDTITMVVADDTDRVFLTPDVEIAYGQATSTFTFTDGTVRDMTMRWTAVLQKAEDKWLLQSVHFSANLLDNPVLRAMQDVAKKTATIIGISGLGLGAAIGAAVLWFLSRRPKSPSDPV